MPPYDFEDFDETLCMSGSHAGNVVHEAVHDDPVMPSCSTRSDSGFVVVEPGDSRLRRSVLLCTFCFEGRMSKRIDQVAQSLSDQDRAIE